VVDGHRHPLVICSFVLCVLCLQVSFKEEEGGRSVSSNLGGELASSSRLVFVFHEASSEGDFDWRLGFQKDE